MCLTSAIDLFCACVCMRSAFVLTFQATGASRGCAFVEFTTPFASRSALDAMQGVTVHGQALSIEAAVLKQDPNVSTDRLHVNAVPQHEGAAALLRTAFEKFGAVSEVILTARPDPDGFLSAFVQFESSGAAAEAQAALDRTDLFKSLVAPDAQTRSVAVSFARKPRNAMDASAGRGGSSSSSSAGGPPLPRSTNVCRFFGGMRGCKEGDRCRFIHPAPDQSMEREGDYGGHGGGNNGGGGGGGGGWMGGFGGLNGGMMPMGGGMGGFPPMFGGGMGGLGAMGAMGAMFDPMQMGAMYNPMQGGGGGGGGGGGAYNTMQQSYNMPAPQHQQHDQQSHYDQQ